MQAIEDFLNIRKVHISNGQSSLKTFDYVKNKLIYQINDFNKAQGACWKRLQKRSIISQANFPLHKRVSQYPLLTSTISNETLSTITQMDKMFICFEITLSGEKRFPQQKFPFQTSKLFRNVLITVWPWGRNSWETDTTVVNRTHKVWHSEDKMARALDVSHSDLTSATFICITNVPL